MSSSRGVILMLNPLRRRRVTSTLVVAAIAAAISPSPASAQVSGTKPGAPAPTAPAPTAKPGAPAAPASKTTTTATPTGTAKPSTPAPVPPTSTPAPKPRDSEPVETSTRDVDEAPSARREAPAPSLAPARAGDAASADTPRGKRDPGRAHLEVGGAYFRASDPNEGRLERGSVIATLGVRPSTALEIAARYRGTFGAWTYLTTQPSTSGGANAKLTTDKRIHRAHLGLRFDLLRTLDVPLRLEP